MPSRRLILKRVAVCTAAVVLLLVLYLAGAPVVVFMTLKFQPNALPVLMIVYAPVDKYVVANRPGAPLYREYVLWCEQRIDETFD